MNIRLNDTPFVPTYYVLFFLQLETRRVTVAGITRHPTAEWM